MIGPWLDPPVLLALPIGVLFGLLLERSGLASARTIADQLAFRDFTVVKVMLSAIVTAMLGVFWATRLGWLDLGQVGIPSTDVVPQLAGAVVFGAGFALASLCPGTACAAVATGRGDGLAVVVGLFAGTLGLTLLWPDLGTLVVRADREGALLPADLGVPTGAVVAMITLGGVLLLPFLSRLERSARPGLPPGFAAVALALGMLAVPASLSSRGAHVDIYDAIAREVAGRADHVEPLDLAEWIRDRRPGLRVVDVRGDAGPDDYVIPGAERVPLSRVARLDVEAGDHVVLYSDGGAHAAQAWVLLRAQGVQNVAVLHDGLAGWEDEVMAPLPALPGDPADSMRFERARGVSAWFGGMPRAERPRATDEVPTRSRRRNTC